jgi:hypothetical protein
MNQGPASVVSTIYNEVNQLMLIVWVEIGTNVLNLIMTCVSVASHLETGRSATHSSIFYLVLGVEVLIEIGQVVFSSVALHEMQDNIRPVNQLTDSLVGKYSESAALCLLPCCGAGGGADSSWIC